MTLPRQNLLFDADFRKLWAGQTVSVFGSLISRTAIPFTAALLLKATPAQMALLAATDMVPGLLIGLFAGAWADRVRRRPLMIAADIGRALLLCLIPLAAWRGTLRMEYLYAVGFLTGMLSMLFEVAYGAYLPTLVGQERVTEGNTKLTATASMAEVGAFGIAGWLVQWFGAALAVGLDAASFVLSAWSLLAIRRPESHPGLHRVSPETEMVDDDAPANAGILAEIVEGMQTVAALPLLRALAIANVVLSLCFRLFGTLIILFITQELKVPTGIQGMIFAVGGVTSLLGSLLAGPLSRRIGFGTTLMLGLVAAGAGAIGVPLAPGPNALGIFLLVLGQVVTDPGYTIFEINQTSLRQAITPNQMRGRVEATFRFLTVAAQLLGIGLAGYLGGRIGLRATMLLGAIGACFAVLPLLFSPVRRLGTLPISS